jgi:hypothetical protein
MHEVYWGHWDITLLRDGRVVGRLPFAVSAAGPADGCVGSALREELLAACRRWVADGVVPDGAIDNRDNSEECKP